jgi:hypothetical protein
LVALKNGWARRTASTTSARATAVATASITAGMRYRGRRNQPDCNERISKVKRRGVLFVERVNRASSRALGYSLVRDIREFLTRILAVALSPFRAQ